MGAICPGFCASSPKPMIPCLFMHMSQFLITLNVLLAETPCLYTSHNLELNFHHLVLVKLSF